MNTILLHPTDVLFFRDGRPMSGSLAGHGAAWPLPNVLNAALHAALHRAGLSGVHQHRRGRSGEYQNERDRKFGCLLTAGPFPVCTNGQAQTWFFPRPADADDSGQPVLLPCWERTAGGTPAATLSSLPRPLRHAVGNTKPPSKNTPKTWWSEGAWNAYLGTAQRDQLAARPFLKSDSNFADTEHAIGIAIDPATDTTGQGDAAGKIYSAHYLRLRDGWQLGVLAKAEDKEFQHPQHGNDLVKALLNGGGHQIIVGGQQRLCTAELQPACGRLPLPLGKTDGFTAHNGRVLVKWVLLSPAVWPEIQPEPDNHITAQPGGWLPNWVAPDTGAVLLKAGDTARQAGEGREAWRKRVRQMSPISARLVAALLPKPIVVTGWALGDEAIGEMPGAQSTHLAVPAGAVYHFETEKDEDARNLAAALNWHGGTNGTEIKNRRSTLLGEKGFGLGVCGTWQFLGETPV
jgi:hypothetical protein